MNNNTFIYDISHIYKNILSYLLNIVYRIYIILCKPKYI